MDENRMKPEHLKGYGNVEEVKYFTIDLQNGEVANCLRIKIGKGFKANYETVLELMRVIDQQTDGKFPHHIHSQISCDCFEYEISDYQMHL